MALETKGAAQVKTERLSSIKTTNDPMLPQGAADSYPVARVLEYREIPGASAARASFDLECASGMVIHECLLMVNRDGRRWVAPPNRAKPPGTAPEATPQVTPTARNKKEPPPKRGFSLSARIAVDACRIGPSPRSLEEPHQGPGFRAHLTGQSLW